jgi:hypothetical protein
MRHILKSTIKWRKNMRELIVAEFITLDGVIQAPGSADEDTEGNFTHGGWTLPYWHDDIGTHFFQAMSEADVLLLGRKTWEIHGGTFERMEVSRLPMRSTTCANTWCPPRWNRRRPGATRPLFATMWLTLSAISSSSRARISWLTEAAC